MNFDNRKGAHPESSVIVKGFETLAVTEEEMISVNDRECIRRAYFVEHKSIREIAREFGHSRKTVRKALETAEPANIRFKNNAQPRFWDPTRN